MEKYLSFQGRTTRSEYWGVMCISILLAFVWVILIGSIGNIIDTDIVDTICGIAIILLAGLTVWAQLAAVARRCRDIEISPWFSLTVFIPYLGIIPWIIFGCLNTVNKEG